MIKTRGDKWTENEISLAKDLYIKGISLSEISKQVNHSESAITKKIQDLSLSNRRIDWTDEDIQKLKELYENGYTYPEIAFELGKTTRGCQAKAIRLGLKKKECNVWFNNSRSDFWTKGVISGDGCIDLKKNHGKTLILRCTIAGNLDLVQNIHSILVKEIGVNPEKKLFKYEHTAQLYRLELNQTETISLYYWFKKNGVKLMERKNKMIEDYLAEKEFKAA